MWFFIIALIAVGIVFGVSNIRRSVVTGPIFELFKRILPPLSQTEREAMEAGSTWWEADLFQGRPDWEKLQAFPKPELSDEEQAFIDVHVPKLMSLIDDFDAIHERKDFSPEAWDYMRRHGFFSLIIPKAYGGKEFSAFANSTIVSQISSRSLSAGVTVMVPNSLGPGELLSHYGTEEQKNYWLPRLASGEDIPCFALTAPEAGSDAGAIPDTGVICMGEHEGKETLGIRLNWDKRYITLAPVATVLGLAFKLSDPDKLLGDKVNIGITCALIPTSHPGVETGDRHLPLEQAFMNGTTRGKDVFIPVDWIIGGPDYAGKGWKMLIECLSAGRGISLPALSTGNCQLSARTTAIYAMVRQQFNSPLYKFEGVSEGLATLGANAYMTEAVRQMTAMAIDQGNKPSVVTAIAKYHMTEAARSSINIAMDIHGGKGIQMGPNNYLASLYMAMPVSITVEGANILTRNLMIFGQGATRCHPYVFDELIAAANPDQEQALSDFETLLGKHVKFAVGNGLFSFFHGLTGGRLISAPETANKKHYRQLERMSKALALYSDIAMLVLGGELKRRELLSARLGDVLSQLYLTSAVLYHHHKRGYRKDEQVYVDYLVARALKQCEDAMYGFTRHISNPVTGWLLRRIVFPFGRSYAPPADKLTLAISDSLCENSELRTRLTPQVYTDNASDPIAVLQQAYDAILALEPLDRKLRKARKNGSVKDKGSLFQLRDKLLEDGIITEDEAGKIRNADKLRLQVVNVDSFDRHLNPHDSASNVTSLKTG